MVYIYILKLLSNKYYVGKTNNPQNRIIDHFNGHGSSWTIKYKPIQIYDIISNCDDYDEDKYTIKLMAQYGIENVRGGTFVKINLDKNDIDTINKMINSGLNRCFNCNIIGHFANSCKIYQVCQVCDSTKHKTIDCLRIIDQLEKEYYQKKKRKIE